MEVSDTRVFNRPLRAQQWFEATITDQIALGRPEQVSLLFGRRPNRRTKGRFETRIVDAYTLPVISFRYKHSTVKQYLKEGVALRTETTSNDAYDFDLGRRLDNLPPRYFGVPVGKRLTPRCCPMRRTPRRRVSMDPSSPNSFNPSTTKIDAFLPCAWAIPGSCRCLRRW